ncbi:hypothetical protein J4Q44_G00252290 [Coregonus suidteri]|uniref:A-kinase anchor protein 6 n=1 Tax=Coregonus suidteri TaxID=861788 RepID=A0AAN8L8D0_9TELE
MNVAVSPMAREAASPMITSVTPTLEPSFEEEAGPSPSQDGLCGEGLAQERDTARRYQNQKPPPLHTGADWKVVLHLPEIETWLRATTERVRDLTHSVHQDSVNKHVDVHLVQLKDICEDISDHVEQIHALLETEFSLKLLSYSVNIIVDIRSVQLLWHQLRVSVLVLKERLLQGLQDSNGNYTRQTDILQAFSQDQQQARLDALTEVDDCGQLTIKCSQDYFSLDCGITAYELSDYSPSEDQEGTSGSGQGQEPCCSYPSLERDFPELIQSVDLLTIAAKQSQSQGAIPEQEEEGPGTPIEKHRDTTSSTGEENNPAPGPKMHCGTPQSESTPLSKRPLQGSVSNEVSPTQPALPKKPMYLEGETESSLSLRRSTLPPSLQFQGDLSRSTPSLLDPPDRSKFWLELNAVYPSNASQSYDSLQAMNSRNLQASRQREAGGYQRPRSPVGAQIPLQRSSSEAGQGGHFPQDLSSIPTLFSGNRGCSRALEDPQTDRDTDSPLPSAMREPSDHESHNKASSEDFHPPTKEAVWIIQPQCPHLHHPATASAEASPNPSEEHWFGSDEFLALPAQLKKTEMLAMKLETLAQRPGHQGHHESIQDVDDWELTEVNSDWEGEGPGSPQPPLGFHALQHPYKRPFRVGMGRFSPTSSSDMAPSLDESIESGPLSDLLSEDEAWSSRESRMRDNNRGWSSGETRGSSTGSRRRDANRSLPLQPTTTTPTTMAPHIERQCKPLIQQLLDDIQHHDNHPDIWGKIEGFVSKLDEFICWLREALETTENWMPPKAEMDSLKLYLETHLSFKLNVDSHCSLKDYVLEEGRQLLEVIISHKSGLRDMLQMVVHQWQQLQRQIRRQHSWMLQTLDAIKAHILATETEASQEAETTGPLASPKGGLLQSHWEAQRDALDQLSLKLKSQQYCTATIRRTGRDYPQMPKNNSLQEFESDFQELWDWLMDMDSVVMDSHELMMSEEQQQHLYKGNSVEMRMWLPKKTHLLGWAECLRRSGAQLPPDFDERVNAMTHKWDQLQKILGESVGSTSPSQELRSALSPHTSSLLGQLESRIKDLKVWLRDTELYIFNSCLRQDTEQDLQASTQLQHFKSLCLEVRGRRKGMSLVLRLSQRLQEEQAQQSSPDSEQQALQLLTVNLERRWEAIIMQVLQWQTRLRRALGTDQVPGNIVEAGLMDLHGPAEDSWEWDEMDMTIVEHMEPKEFDDKQNAECESGPGSPGAGLNYDMSESSPRVTQRGMSLSESSGVTPLSSQRPNVYQVYSLHNVELYRQPHFPSVHKTSSPAKAGRKQPLLKSLSKDSSFSSVESLPDLLGGLLVWGKQGGHGGESARRSESESGIVSEGETETTANSEVCLDDPRRGGSTSLRPPTGVNSPGEDDDDEGDRVCDEDIDRILERANKVALYGDSVSVTALRKRDQNRSKAGKKKRGGGEEGGSSLESLYAAGELFPSGKDNLQHSTSLESWLAPCKSWEEAEGEGGSQGSLRELGLGTGAIEPTGELSHRTLELLKRLENIQTPLHDLKMTRSISDITLQSSSSLRHPGVEYGPGGPGHAGRLSGGRGGSPSSVNKSSAASLTELSSTEDSSVGTEDLAVLRNSCCLLDSNASFRKHHHRAQPGDHHGGHGGHDEADASISMVVNVSCTSACTDDEDDSDLLSSSTLTLTEEELGIKEDEEDDSDLLSSSTLTLTEEELGIKEDEEDDSDLLSSSTLTLTEEELGITSEEEYMEGSLSLGLEYMKNEFHNWIHNPSRSQQQSQSSCGWDKNQGYDPLGDELQCGTLSKDRTNRPSVGNERCSFLNRSALRLLESHTNSNVKKECLRTLPDVVDTNRKNATRSYISQFVDDMENGNVDNSHIKGKDEDNELLREEGSLFTKKGECFKDCYVNESVVNGGDQQRGMGMATATTPSLCETLSQLQAKESSLESQLRGEIPCQSSSHSSPSLSPLEDCRGSHHHHALQRPPRSGNNSQENLFSSFLSDVHTQQSIGDASSNPGPDPNSDHPCCSHLHPQVPPCQDQKSQENMHNFVMEIIDIASVALKNKESQAEDKERPGQTGAQIRDKVLEQSHRPIHLHKGDFYSYLSINSHDSDCGEVSTYIDSKSTTPLLSTTPDIRDKEMLFEACTEEVYLGPPLCYSMAVTKRPRRHSPKLMDCYSSSPSPAAQSQSQSQAPLPTCNEYQKAHEEGSLCINPKINCPPIRNCDRDEKGPTSQWMKHNNVRKSNSSLQEVKSIHKQKQSPRSGRGCGEVGGQGPRGSGPVLVNSSASKTGTARPQVMRLSGSVASATSKAQL